MTIEHINLRASATTDPVAMAGAIAGEVRKFGRAEIHAMGPQAVNQTVKAIAIARGYVAPNGIELRCIPSFIDLAEDKTGIRFLVVTS